MNTIYTMNTIVYSADRKDKCTLSRRILIFLSKLRLRYCYLESEVMINTKKNSERKVLLNVLLSVADLSYKGTSYEPGLV